MKGIIVFILFNFLFFSFTGCSHHKHKEHKHKAGKHHYNAHFGDMDIDGNDLINWDEFKKHFPHAKKEVFIKADANKDEFLDHDEWHTFKEKRGYKHHK